jgi:uncharacterized surface protein with fasciclin (FAS1) repeats
MFERPGWLAGKLYTQILSKPELSTFASCLKRTGYDTIINVSGSYTVFAPSNDAFTLYFQTHTNYTTVNDIPISELTRLVKFHIVQNPWSKDQLEQLDVFGWIDTSDLNNNLPRGFKRETVLRENDKNFGIKQNLDRTLVIVDSSLTGWHRKQATDYRKFAPILFKEYFDIYKLSLSDYSFYFGRNFENPADIYFASGKITTADIFAENGFVHIIDRVIEPMQNAYEILSTQKNNISYSKFLNLINNFPEFLYNSQRTLAQPGAHEGLAVDSLFDISYPDLTFAITNELTNAPKGTTGLPSNVTIRYQYGLVGPTNQAMDDFVNEYLAGPGKWGNLDYAPIHIKRIIANTHMSNYPIYPSNLNQGFLNGEQDIVTVDQASIVQKQYGSNCSFIGTNKMIIPRAFKSVAGPVYLQTGYSIAMYAIEQSGLLAALKRENQNFMFFVESDVNLRVDSSLYYYTPRLNPNGTLTSGRFSAFVKALGSIQQVNLTTNDLRTLLLNHIGTANPKGVARKEFIQNLAGNYLIVNNQTGAIQGTSATTIGFRGPVQLAVNIPVQISTNSDNGKTFDVVNWFNFNTTTLFVQISTSYAKFHALLKKAGLTKDLEYRYTFVSENQNYTVFVPNDAALAAYNTDTLTLNELQQFCMMHFVQGNLIFTDGNQPSGYYPTSRIDASSTPYSTVNTQIFINPGTDVINFPDKLGNNYLTVDESPVTNLLTGRTLGTTAGAFPNTICSGVIHEINKVLLFNQLDTRTK